MAGRHRPGARRHQRPVHRTAPSLPACRRRRQRPEAPGRQHVRRRIRKSRRARCGGRPGQRHRRRVARRQGRRRPASPSSRHGPGRRRVGRRAASTPLPALRRHHRIAAQRPPLPAGRPPRRRRCCAVRTFQQPSAPGHRRRIGAQAPSDAVSGWRQTARAAVTSGPRRQARPGVGRQPAHRGGQVGAGAERRPGRRGRACRQPAPRRPGSRRPRQRSARVSAP